MSRPIMPPTLDPLPPQHLRELSQAVSRVEVGGVEPIVPRERVMVQLDLHHGQHRRLRQAQQASVSDGVMPGKCGVAREISSQPSTPRTRYTALSPHLRKVGVVAMQCQGVADEVDGVFVEPILLVEIGHRHAPQVVPGQEQGVRSYSCFPSTQSTIVT